jgi:hypothetical protein
MSQQKLRHFSPMALVMKCATSLMPEILELHVFFKPLGTHFHQNLINREKYPYSSAQISPSS